MYATVGFILSPDKLATLPVQGVTEIILIVGYGLAGVIGITAVIMLADVANQVIPLTEMPLTPAMYRKIVRDHTIRVSRRFRLALRFAGIAVFVIIAGSGYLLIAGAVATNHPHATIISPTGAYCGELLDSNGKLSLRLQTGEVIPVAGDSLTQVSSCPG